MPDELRPTTGPDEELVPADDAIIGKAFRYSLGAFVVIGCGIGLTVWALSRPEPVAPPKENPDIVPAVYVAADKAPALPFADITDAAGIDFVHVNGAYGEKLLPETMGSGVAFFDYDNDGDQDLLLVNSNYWPGNKPADAAEPTMAMYRNDGAGKFEDVTSATGLDVTAYGMGVAVGDYDGDGWRDVYITVVGANLLLKNNEGVFANVTAQAGVAGADDAWGTSAGFVDIDNDGDLDLFVCNYIRWSRDIDMQVDYRLEGVGRAYGPPTNFQGAHPYLFRNNGDGTFAEIGESAGLHISNTATGVPVAKALGVAPLDVDRDGWIDLMIANDTTQNFLFRNKGDGMFEENGTLYGLAYDKMGVSTGAMGIDGAFYRGDDTVGLFVGNFANEMTSVYVSQGRSTLFADEAIGEGIGSPTRLVLSFGLFLFDADLDGRLDLLQANGHLEEDINTVQSSQHYEQPAQLFWNCGPKARACFVEVGHDESGDLATPRVGRGAAYADIDNDGDLDVVLTQTARRAILLRNDQQQNNNWLRLQLTGTTSNRDAIGAWVELKTADSTIRRQVMPTRSYLSQVELPVTIGLGKADKADTITITWPGGEVQTLSDLSAGKTHHIRQGEGVVDRPKEEHHRVTEAQSRN